MVPTTTPRVACPVVVLLSGTVAHIPCTNPVLAAGGELVVRMKPCPQFGVASAIWLYNYSFVACCVTVGLLL